MGVWYSEEAVGGWQKREKGTITKREEEDTERKTDDRQKGDKKRHTKVEIGEDEAQ